MPKTVDELIASVPAAHFGLGCWASQLEGDAAKFVAGCKTREATGVKLLRGAIIDILKKQWNVTIGEEALRKHLNGRCRCA